MLTVATLEPRKNLGTLVEAFALLADTGLALAVVGGAGWGEQPQLDRPGIVRLGRVDDDELARLYRGAAAVVYPSRFEGFGMPITEAMASGAPVVASAHASMDEACGDAAVRADPESPEAIAAAIREALGRRDELRARGLAHARGFSWRAYRRDLPRGVRAIRVALDTTPLLQTRAGTARYVHGAAASTCDVAVEVSFPATSRLRTRRRRRRSGTRACARRAAPTCCTARRSAGRSAPQAPLVVTVHDLAVLRHPEWFNRWTRDLLAASPCRASSAPRRA